MTAVPRDKLLQSPCKLTQNLALCFHSKALHSLGPKLQESVPSITKLRKFVENAQSALSFLTSKLKLCFQRFPLTCVFAVSSSLLALMNLWKYDFSVPPCDFLASLLGLPLAFAAETFLAGKRDAAGALSSSTPWILRGSVLALVSACLWFLSGTTSTATFLSYGLFQASAHLLCAFAPFLKDHRQDQSLWQWNIGLFSRFVLSAIYSHVLLAGLLMGLSLFAFLFQVIVPHQVYWSLCIVLLILFQTIFYASSTPYPLNIVPENSQQTLPSALQKFVQWILLPLLLLYFILLLSYGSKILISLNLPRGGVALLVLVFSILGLLNWLLLWPIHADLAGAPKLARFFRRYFLVSLIPLMVLFGFSVSERLMTYGMTERRYILTVGFLWLCAMIAAYGFGRKIHLIYLPASLCSLCLLISFGPQGMLGFSWYWQMTRLENLWVEAQQTQGAIPTLRKVKSTLEYLLRKNREIELRDWLKTHGVPSNQAQWDADSIIASQGWAHTAAEVEPEKYPSSEPQKIYRSLQLNAEPIQVGQQLVLIPFHIQIASAPKFKMDHNDSPISAAWIEPGKTFVLQYEAKSGALEFELNADLQNQMQKALQTGIHTVSGHDFLLPSKNKSQNPSYNLLVQSIGWTHVSGVNQNYELTGTLIIQDTRKKESSSGPWIR